MKRFYQWPYLVIAILVLFLVNDRTIDSQIKILKSPDQEQLTLTSAKSGDGHKLRLSVGEMLLETDELRALHNDGTETLISARNGKVRISHQQSSMEAKEIMVSLDNGLLGKERKGLFGK